MHRYALVAGVLAGISLAMLPSAPAFAITAKHKMATCKFGADHPMLTGKDREIFLKKCMSNTNDPRGPGIGTPGGTGEPKG
jgi:hypothetical protein